MIEFFIKLYNFISKKFEKFVFFIFNKCFCIFGFNFKLVPYSDWTSKIFLIYKKKLHKKNFGLKQNCYFGFKVFSQGSDLRGVFKNCWDGESTRIAALFSLNKIFDKFDFFDLGANYGLYSLPFTNLEKISNHLIVEPNPFLTTCLERTFIHSKAQVISNAITVPDQNKKLLFNVKPFASGASSLIDSNRNISPLSILQINVESMSYKYMFDRYKSSKNAIIKIDIEGAEIDLLKDGFLKYLNKIYTNFIIMIEYIPSFYSNEQSDLFKKELSNYFCVPLTNLNFRDEIDKNYETNFFLNQNSIAHFYKTKYDKGIEWFANDKHFLYSDIIVFSNKKLAIEAMNI